MVMMNTITNTGLYYDEQWVIVYMVKMTITASTKWLTFADLKKQLLILTISKFAQLKFDVLLKIIWLGTGGPLSNKKCIIIFYSRLVIYVVVLILYILFSITKSVISLNQSTCIDIRTGMAIFIHSIFILICFWQDTL